MSVVSEMLCPVCDGVGRWGDDGPVYYCRTCKGTGDMNVPIQPIRAKKVKKNELETIGVGRMKQLKKGDIIEIEEGHKIYVNIPQRFIFSNRQMSWKLDETDIKVGENKLGLDTSIFAGKYVVSRTKEEPGSTGGGMNGHDDWPGGHKVYCRKIPAEREFGGTSLTGDDKSRDEISFYQSGCFTAMITDIEPIGRAKVVNKILVDGVEV